MPQQTLSGIRVVDLTRAMAGPYATMMLGDMGADVVKIEQPGKGDDTRAWGPPFIQGESAYFLSVNRNKQSITLNLKLETARAVVWRLVERADVLVENFSPGTAAKLGFGYEAVAARRPNIVYCSISGFGQQGPFRDRTAYDLIVQGMSGMMSITGPAGGEPFKLGVPLADIVAGMFAAYAVVSALFHRERTGEGQYIDTTMLGGQMALLTYQAAIYFATGVTPQSSGNAHPILAPYQTFRTRDGYVNVAVGNDAMFARFCGAVGLGHLPSDPRFRSNADRITHLAALVPLVEPALQAYDSAELLRRLEQASVPAGPINTVPQAFADPQAETYHLRQRVHHATLGDVDQVGFPYLLSQTPCAIRYAPPTLGQHTDEILSALGYAKDEIGRLRAEGAL